MTAPYSSLSRRQTAFSMASVITNYFDQISPSGSGQYHNKIILSALDANSVVFNNTTYPCVWSYTIDGDGQWQQIVVSFSRKQSIAWPVETYVRVGLDIFILQSRAPAISCDRPADDGTFYSVPLKILRSLLASMATSRPIPPSIRNYLHHGPGASCVEYYWQATYLDPIGNLSILATLDAPVRSAEEDDDYAVLNTH